MIILYCLFLYFQITFFKLSRLEKNSRVNDLLNDESKLRRSHTRTINIQVSVITWSIEFLTGCVFMVLCLVINNIAILGVLVFFDGTLSFLVIPSVYILNTEVTKALIIANGWFRSFRTLVSSKRIQPAANEELV